MKKNKDFNYYDAGGLSVVDIWKAKLTKEELRGFFTRTNKPIKFCCKCDVPEEQFKKLEEVPWK